MYDKQGIVEKTEELFEEFKKQAHEIIALNKDRPDCAKRIMNIVSSELHVRSKTLATDMLAQMSARTLSSDEFEDAARKNLFYEANIRSQILRDHPFDLTDLNCYEPGIGFKEIPCMQSSLVIASGTAAAGGALKYLVEAKSALGTRHEIPVVMVLATVVAAFCAAYFKVIPERNDSAFRKAVDNFLSDVKAGFILWFDEIEKNYIDRVEKIRATF